MLAQARLEASKAGLNISFHEGDAASLPYRDSSFDMVVSDCPFTISKGRNIK
jgi:ubiquinone/menaquinone biosynthesis C-methylase UbiE